MPTKKTKKTSALPKPSRRTFLAGVDVVKLSQDLLEDAGSPAYLMYTKLRAELMEYDEEAVAISKLLDAIDSGPAVIEGAMSQAGFVVGFRCAMQLIMGELVIPAPAPEDGAK